MSGIAVVVVTYDSAGSIGETLAALAPQLTDDDEVVVVDSGSSDDSARRAAEALPSAQVIALGRNVGFAAGCNAAAAASRAPLLFLLNPDATPAPDCLDELRRAAGERPQWGAWQALVTLPGGERINTAGNVVHFLGFGWAGRFDEPVAVAGAPSEPAFPSGAALAVRRSAWEALGGFDERFFMYCEDLDLGLRLRLAGFGVGMWPGARVEHAYEFHKGERKWFLLERNRWRVLLRVYPAPLLVLLAPGLLATEVALLAVAAEGGWLRAKLRAQRAVLGDLRETLAARRAVQSTRAVGAREFASHLTAVLDSEFLGPAARIGPVVALQRAYWAVVVRLLPG